MPPARRILLRVPTDIFVDGGIPRSLARVALADRVPAAILAERRQGYQAADWAEGFGAARPLIRDEIELLARCPAAAAALDIGRMRALVEEWPGGGWDEARQSGLYRGALLRAMSAGHFIRKAAGQ